MFGKLFVMHVQFLDSDSKEFGYTENSAPLPVVVAKSALHARDSFLANPENVKIQKAVLNQEARVVAEEIKAPVFPS